MVERSLTFSLQRSQTARRDTVIEANVEQNYIQAIRAAHTLYERMPDNDHIRLLILQPAYSEKDPINCSLAVLSRADAQGKYAAVSYTWGSNTRSSVLVCEGVRLPVTVNCEAAIRSLRHVKSDGSGQARRIWIDSVCIAQDDKHERSAQVARMGDTFAEAEECIVYLGHMDQHTETVKKMLDLCNRDQSLTSFMKPNAIQRFKERYSDPEPSKGAVAIESILDRPWFSRTWVLQEVLLASKLSIQIGRQNFFWSDFVNVLTICNGENTASSSARPLSPRLNRQVNATSPFQRSVIQLYKQYGRTAATEPLVVGSRPAARDRAGALDHREMVQILESTASLHCRDPQDKLFALAPLFKPLPTALQPDYEKSVTDVFLDWTEFLLRQDLEKVLSLAQYTHLNHELPSWAVWWAALPMHPTLVQTRRLAKAANETEEPQFSRSKLSLTVRGAVMTKIIKVYSETRPYAVNRSLVRRQTGQSGLQWERSLISALAALPQPTTVKQLDLALGPAPSGCWCTFETESGQRGAAARTEIEGLDPYGVKAGDYVCGFHGCHGFFILRRHELVGTCKLIGECTFVSKDKLAKPIVPTFGDGGVPARAAGSSALRATPSAIEDFIIT